MSDGARQEALSRFLDAFEELLESAREAEVDISLSCDFGDEGISGAQKTRFAAIAKRLASDPRTETLKVVGTTGTTQ